MLNQNEIKLFYCHFIKLYLCVCVFVKVLVLKRPSNGSYPGAIVFPGGVVESADQTKDWLEFYRKFGVDDSKFKSINKTTPNRSFIFQCDNKDTLNR